MSIFTIIKNKIFRKNIEDTIPSNSINIIIYDDGFYDLKLNLISTNKQDAENLSKLLFDINSGKLYDLFITEMTNEASKNDKMNIFMVTTMNMWQNLFVKQKNQAKNLANSNLPVIKPSKVFWTQK
jgi:hypothetical protein